MHAPSVNNNNRMKVFALKKKMSFLNKQTKSKITKYDLMIERTSQC